MISDFLYRNPRILIPLIALIFVAGISSYYVLPRMEDPVLGKRVAVVSTSFPGADAERVESLVTRPIEDAIAEVEGIEEIRSTSRAGVSNVVVELRDAVTEVEPVWSQVRDHLDDSLTLLPDQASSPEFHRFELKAYATIIALKWNDDRPENLAILRRLARDLKSQLSELNGTERVDLFGDPGEELLVELEPTVLNSLGLSTAEVAKQLTDSDAQQPAGLIRDGVSEIPLEVSQQTDPRRRVGETRIQYGQGRTTSLSEIAEITKGPVDPASKIALADGKRSIVLGVFVRDDYRVDRWSGRAQQVLDRFQQGLPDDINVDVLFSQSEYIDKRHNVLVRNLIASTLAVVLVVFLLMGWRSTLIVGVSLPLSALMVVTGMRAMGIPIHQMSITGLIIALGLLIDNAIVMVDEVRARIRSGSRQRDAVRHVVRHFAIPLFGSTLTTTLAFVPIATLPGPPGEFVGTIAVSVILAINSSFILAMTVVPAMTALLPARARTGNPLDYGLSSEFLTRLYRYSLDFVFRFPLLGILLGATLPFIGYLQSSQLPEQFFPASDRNQIQIEIELPAMSSASETEACAKRMRDYVTERSTISRMHWFIGESAPTFYYNVVPRRRGTPFYAQAIIDVHPGVDTQDLVHQLQNELDAEFPQCRTLVRQLEQGPPFDAPIELRVRGPDLAELERLGSELRQVLVETDQVIHTRSDLEETIPKYVLEVDEVEARLANLTEAEVAKLTYSSLEGMTAGTVNDGADAVPIRVRIAGRESLGIERLAGLELTLRQQSGPPSGDGTFSEGGPPLSALARVKLDAEVGAITRIDGERMNEVKGYLTAGTLPSVATKEFKQRLKESEFELPNGYSLEYGGESAERNEAVDNLLANAVVVFALMLLTLVVSFRSFRASFIIAAVGGLSIGLGPGALWWFGFPFGFMAIVGTMGLVGVAVNDAIVVMAGIRADARARSGNRVAIRNIVIERTRHVLATTLTTIAGFTPLVIGGGGFWPPMAITIAGGVGGATILALYFVPSMYLTIVADQRR